jgi:hypothetical protein
MNPLRSLSEAVTLPFKAVFVIAICFAINLMTAPGHWWVQWVILGMGIALIVTWARALRVLVLGALAAAVGTWAYRRYGDAGRETVNRWLAQANAPRSG